jgi:polar amino acid transport system substrate-binding protein
MHISHRAKIRLWLAMLPLTGATCTLAQDVVLHYHSRAPYTFTQEGTLSGLTGSPAVNAFTAANIPFTITETPAARQLVVLKSNQGLDCAIGWFKSLEREVFGRFTKPIYRDEPQVVMIAAENTKIKDGDTIDSVLGNKTLELLVKESYSYGGDLDALIDQYQPKRVPVSGGNQQMIKMIKTQRADYIFVAPEEAEAAISLAGYRRDQFKLMKLSGMPKGENRHILCSKKVSNELINKLNGVIK